MVVPRSSVFRCRRGRCRCESEEGGRGCGGAVHSAEARLDLRVAAVECGGIGVPCRRVSAPRPPGHRRLLRTRQPRLHAQVCSTFCLARTCARHLHFSSLQVRLPHGHDSRAGRAAACEETCGAGARHGRPFCPNAHLRNNHVLARRHVTRDRRTTEQANLEKPATSSCNVREARELLVLFQRQAWTRRRTCTCR